MVGGCVIGLAGQGLEAGVRCLPMAADAERVAVRFHAGGVGIVAVGAAHAGALHLALQERAVNIDLVLDLAVREVELLAQERRPEVVQERRAVFIVLGDRRAPRVAPGAGLDLPSGRVFFETDDQARVGVFGLLAGPRPGDVPRAGAVAGLAADVDLGPARRVAFAFEIIALAIAGRVAFAAAAVPVVQPSGPVARIAGRDLGVGQQVEPALSLRVPGDGQRLQPAPRLRDQVLLQGGYAEGIDDLEIGEPAVGAIRVDDVFAVFAEEARGDARMCESRVVEVAEDGVLGGFPHGPVVMGAGPGLSLRLVAGDTGLPADEICGGGGRRARVGGEPRGQPEGHHRGAAGQRRD